ncbi:MULTISPECIES: carboxymuconolactone decarboxylase family protein [unclassified Marinobacter]|uniref:carboxymuconolactone decarboxylase family protein n=1 Tax=unclassified Marinobacter TaxID=83889 RepID=UPI000BF686AC|nr:MULTISPECIES: carboxymuconolactone decarboxylase family protein [unclassified Marinobacter]PFG10643.1 4-carboxymuconolactone decarboxylase [Marinobacter sp. LV10MA510-1]PFG52559.1 4-carboxymuconolactone decarboxylase [Marinobacter sp. LV10R520-4]
MSGVTRSNRLTCALSLLKTLEADAPTKVTASLDALSDDFAEVVLGFSFADVIARPSIDLRTREMLTVAMLAAMGNAPGQLDFHMRAALNIGLRSVRA